MASNKPLDLATPNGQDNIGWPWNSRTFLRGILLLPPLAGMIANNDILLITKSNK
jgi:hypothetical protein